MDKKIIPSIEPYNELFHTCFSSSFVPVLRHFRRSEVFYWFNEVFFYEYNTSKGKIEFLLALDNLKPFEQLVNEQGIITKSKLKSENIIEDIITSITNDMPAITWVDSYYDSSRSDTYMKMHMKHSILFYGFDKQEEIFYIIDQKHHENVMYERKTISFLEAANAYTGLFENFTEGDRPSFYSFGLDNNINFDNNDIPHEQYVTFFLDNVRYKKEKLIKGLSDLKDFIEDFEKWTYDDTEFITRAETILTRLNRVIIIKQIEMYKVSLLFEKSSKYVTLQADILNAWINVRVIVAKIVYSSNISRNSLNMAIYKLEQIYDMEQEFYSNF